MTEITLGQVWKRIPPQGDKFFPKNSWKVKVIGYEEGIVYHQMVEYDGDARHGGTIFQMDESDFLKLYELT